MTTAKLAFEELTNPGARPRQRKFREVDFTPPHDLPVVDLIELYTGIEFALPTNQGLVVQFVAATSSRDNEQVALDMAWAAASALHKRVLVLTCSGPSSRRALRGPDPLPANDGARIDVLAPEMRMMKVAAHEMYVADIGDWYGNTGALGALDEMDIQLAEFREMLDMIVTVPPPADSDPLAAVMARHVDGNVIVIEAETTRRSAAIRLRETLARSGRPIVGTVLCNRRNYVPRWLARIL
jgi:Mrp family chromosome partitioning ATPase